MKPAKKQAGKRIGRSGAAPKRAYASTLRWHMAATPGFATRIEIPIDAANVCRAEFRALLAVAKAAGDHSHADVDPTADGSDETCPICRALARLSRAGGER